MWPKIMKQSATYLAQQRALSRILNGALKHTVTPQNVIIAAKCNTNAKCNNINAKCNKVINGKCNNFPTQNLITFLTQNVITQIVITPEFQVCLS